MPTEEIAVEQFLELWGAPINEEAPCGEDCSFATEFENVQAEVAKDDSLHDEVADWALVLRLTSEILSTQSKDVWLLAYAVYGVYHVKGLDACPAAFAAFTQILRNWWDSLYPLPTRVQRRLAPLTWLCSRMERRAETTCFYDGSADSVRALQDEFAKLQELLTEKVGEEAPYFPGVFSKLPTSASGQPEQEAAAPSGANPPAQSQPTLRQASMPLSVSLAEMEKDGRIPPAILPNVVRNVIDTTRQLAEHYLSQNPADERGISLSCLGLWSTLTQLPVTDSEGRTQLNCGVPADRIQEYIAAVEGKRYAEILPHLARAAGRSPYWFEGHALLWRCLEGLEASQAAVCLSSALGALLYRFPDLLSYKYKDNSPFAPAKVLPWLESLSVAPASSKALHVVGQDSSAKAADEESRLQEAVACNMEKGFEAGLRLLGTVPPGRSRISVLQGILQARYCLAAGKKNAAVQILAGLYQQMEEWHLLDWEPDLTARILALLLTAQPKQRGGAVDGMVRRLHLLDLDMALSVVKEH